MQKHFQLPYFCHMREWSNFKHEKLLIRRFFHPGQIDCTKGVNKIESFLQLFFHPLEWLTRLNLQLFITLEDYFFVVFKFLRFTYTYSKKTYRLVILNDFIWFRGPQNEFQVKSRIRILECSPILTFTSVNKSKNIINFSLHFPKIYLNIYNLFT